MQIFNYAYSRNNAKKLIKEPCLPREMPLNRDFDECFQQQKSDTLA